MRRTQMAPTMLMVALLLACSGGDQEADRGRLLSTEAGIVGFEDFTDGEDKSFGIFVCAQNADVTLDAVEPISSEGDIEILGALLLEAEDGFVGAVHHFPPEGLLPEATSEVEGAVVTSRCGEENPAVRSQVIVGAARTGPGGGMIDGLRIGYQGGSLELTDYQIILCGDQDEFCEDIEG